MKKILYMIDTTGPGGAETLFIELSKKFMEVNMVLSIVHGPGWVENQLIKNNINHLKIERKGSFNIKFILQLIKIIKINKIDVIHAHLLRSSIYASIAGLITKTPVISTFHGLVDINETDNLLNKKIFLLKKSSTIIAVSKKIKEYLINSTALTEQDIKIIANGIHLKNSTITDKQSFRKKYNIPNNHTIIGCLGNIRPAKDYQTAIETMKILTQTNNQVVLLIAGDTNNSLYEDYLNLIKKFSLESHVKFIGFTEDPYNFLSNLDIFLMTSTSEGQPISLFQAMSQKLPIIGTECGIEDILNDGETAWLSPVKSPKSLTKNILSALEDSEESLRRATNAYEYVYANYNIETMFQNYNELYGQLISNN